MDEKTFKSGIKNTLLVLEYCLIHNQIAGFSKKNVLFTAANCTIAHYVGFTTFHSFNQTLYSYIESQF